MANIRRSESIDQYTGFTQAVEEYTDACLRVEKITDENSLQFEVATAAVMAAWRALVAVINGYCADKISETLEQIQLRRR